MQKQFKGYSFSVRPNVAVAREGEDQPITLTAAELKAQIDAAVSEQVKGLKGKNDELIGKLKTRDETLKNFDGVNLEEVRKIQNMIEQDEDLRLIAEGKTNLVIEKHTSRMREAHKAELEAAQLKIVETEKTRDAWRGSVLDNQIRSAAQGLHPGAVEDALLHGRNVFTLDAKGKAVQLDASGNPVLGKDGQTPFSPAEWMEAQKELKPHWFLATSTGSGGQGSHAGQGGQGKTITRTEFEKLPGVEKAKVAQSGIKIID